jgi:hypothetical protein
MPRRSTQGKEPTAKPAHRPGQGDLPEGSRRGARREEEGTLDNSGSPVANATDRCNVLPAKDKADCLARIVGPQAEPARHRLGSVEAAA